MNKRANDKSTLISIVHTKMASLTKTISTPLSSAHTSFTPKKHFKTSSTSSEIATSPIIMTLKNKNFFVRESKPKHKTHFKS